MLRVKIILINQKVCICFGFFIDGYVKLIKLV